jgi:hypothetical protein
VTIKDKFAANFELIILKGLHPVSNKASMDISVISMVSLADISSVFSKNS